MNKALVVLGVLTLCACAPVSKPTTEPSPSSAASSTADWRTIFEADKRTDISTIEQTELTNAMQRPIRADVAMWVPYENPSLGIRVEFPWNPAWGSQKFKVLPYEEWEEEGDRIFSFGPLEEAMEGPAWFLSRYDNMIITPPRPAADIIAEASGNTEITDVESLVIGKLSVVKVRGGGFCDSVWFEIPGTKANVRVSGACVSDATPMETFIARMQVEQ